MHSPDTAIEKILIIEDEPDIRANLQEILEISQYKVTTASNGAEGVTLAKEIQPDLIICDINMPVMDGYEVLESLQNMPETSLIPFIFLTARSDLQELRQGMELGADDYLIKPLNIQDLLVSVRTRLLKHQRFVEQIQQVEELSQAIQSQVKETESHVQEQEHLLQVKDKLLSKILENLSDSVSNIHLIATMLKKDTASVNQSKYISILESEANRQLKLLNDVIKLQGLLKPENVDILKRYDLLN
ncbi:response regulator [Synechocystis sp. LKSZ1]|uniref:response regulator n=1 Tax=Synechocystis sp. LKSZ1 TaxID=3144951 RepID=UPI00336BBDF5